MTKKSKHFSVGDNVFAKVKGYPAWPAKVVEITGKKFRVSFYGTGEFGIVKTEDLFPYLECKDQFTKSLRRKDYNDALEEIEEAIRAQGSDFSNRTENEENKTGIKRKLSTEHTEQDMKIKKTSSKNATENKEQDCETSTLLEDTSVSDEHETDDESKKNNKETRKKPSKNVKEENSKFVVVSSSQLQKTIDECSKIMQGMDDNEEIDKIPEDLTSLASNAVLLARISYGKYIGIKINKDRPLHFKNGVERLQWAVDNAQRSLDLKDKVECFIVDPSEDPDSYEMELELSKAQLKSETATRIMDRKKNKLLWLKIESCLVELDALIKTSLALDKADPQKALKHLNAMHELTIDPLMLKKHPHVVDMVKRLRRYIGNVREWNLGEDELSEFKKQAELIRAKAESVYDKFKKLFDIPEDSTFSEVFQNELSKFRDLTKELTEGQVFALCAEPGSKQAEWDELDDQEEASFMQEKMGMSIKENVETENVEMELNEKEVASEPVNEYPIEGTEPDGSHG